MLTKTTWLLVLLLVFINKIFQIVEASSKSPNALISSTTESNAHRNESNRKISGGYIGDPKLWGKFTVSIRHFAAEQQKFGKGHFCGGTIITRTVILTASHCFYSYAIEARGKNLKILVVVGAPKIHKYKKRTQVIKVADIILHPHYDPVTHHNDIALLILAHKIIVDGKTSAIITLPNHAPRALMKCTAAGWGAIYYV